MSQKIAGKSEPPGELIARASTWRAKALLPVRSPTIVPPSTGAVNLIRAANVKSFVSVARKPHIESNDSAYCHCYGNDEPSRSTPRDPGRSVHRARANGPLCWPYHLCSHLVLSDWRVGEPSRYPASSKSCRASYGLRGGLLRAGIRASLRSAFGEPATTDHALFRFG